MKKLILKKHPNFEFSLIELMNVIIENQTIRQSKFKTNIRNFQKWVAKLLLAQN